MIREVRKEVRYYGCPCIFLLRLVTVFVHPGVPYSRPNFNFTNSCLRVCLADLFFPVHSHISPRLTASRSQRILNFNNAVSRSRRRQRRHRAVPTRLSARLCDRSHDQSPSVKGSSDRARPRSNALSSTSLLNNAIKRSRERPNRPVRRAPFNSIFRYPCVYAPRFVRASNTPSVKGP